MRRALSESFTAPGFCGRPGLNVAGISRRVPVATFGARFLSAGSGLITLTPVITN